MPVYQSNSGGLGEALLQAFAGYSGARRQKRLDTQDDEDRLRRNAAVDRAEQTQRIVEAQQGIHRLGPMELPPLEVAHNIADQIKVPDAPSVAPIDFTQHLSDAMQQGPRGQPVPGAPSKASAGAQFIPGNPAAKSASSSAPSSDPGSAFQRMMAPALASAGMPQRGPRYEFGKDYYVDNQPKWEQQDAASASQRNAKIFEIALQDALATANMGRDVRKEELLSPIRTEQAANTERALSPIRTDQAANTERALSPIRTDQAEATARATSPIIQSRETATHAANREFDVAHPVKDATALSPAQANTVKGQQSALMNMKKAITALREAVSKGGMAVMPGKHQDEIKALQTNLQIQYKEAANLGAITGPDMELINNALGSPTSLYQKIVRGGKEGVLKSLEAAEQSLRDRAKTMKSVYGVDMPPGFEDAPVTPAGFSTIPQTGGILGDTNLNPFSALIPKKP